MISIIHNNNHYKKKPCPWLSKGRNRFPLTSNSADASGSREKWPGGALTGERCSRHQPWLLAGLMPEHLPYCTGKQTSTLLPLRFPLINWFSLPFLMQLPCGPGAKGGFSFPRDSWIKQWEKGVLRDHCSQHLMAQDILMVTSNIINLLIVAFPPDNKLLPLASLTHPCLGHPSHVCPQQKLQISKFLPVHMTTTLLGQ